MITEGIPSIDEQPLPALVAAHAVENLHHVRGERAADHERNGRGRHEERERLAAPMRRKPEGQVEDDAWLQACFEGPHQEAQRVELPGLRHPRHQHAHDAPAHRDAHDRLRGAEFLQQQVARHFEEEVAEEEDAGAGAIDGIGPCEVAHHGQLREADVDAVDPGQEPDQRKERNQAPDDLAKRDVALVDR